MKSSSQAAVSIPRLQLSARRRYSVTMMASAEIVGRGEGGAQTQLLETARADRNHSVLLLQHSLDHQNRRIVQQRAIGLKQIGNDYRIGYAGLVFHCEKEKSFRRAGTLAHDHDPRRFHPRAVRGLRKFGGGEAGIGEQLVEHMRDEM